MKIVWVGRQETQILDMRKWFKRKLKIMKTIFSGEKIKNDRFSIFLAGPSLRDSITKSQRIEALEILEGIQYDGYVYNTEAKVFKEDIIYEYQIGWEREVLSKADRITSYRSYIFIKKDTHFQASFRYN